MPPDAFVSQNTLFPPSYSPWLGQRLAGTVIETLATCDACAMEHPTGVTRDPGPFDPTLKCCTYFPFVPNFGLGLMLEKNSAETLLRLRTAEARGILLPMGLHSTPEYQNRMAEFGQDGFGRARELLCPFYDTRANGCSVWENRPGVCTTYFCKSNRGAEGLGFWKELEDYLNHFEWALASAVFERLGLGEEQMEMCKATMSIEEPGEEREYFANLAWGSWTGKKHEFFLAAADHARQITPSELDGLLGENALHAEDEFRKQTQQA